MAATATQIVSSISAMDCETHHLEFTSTTATVEVSTGLSKILAANYIRIGNVDNDDASILTIDEATNFTAGEGIAVQGGAITVDRQGLTGTGTLTAEDFILCLYGKS